jgi:uncharacterized protein (TIGR02598 family)
MKTRNARLAAFSLVEVTLALGVAAFALVAVFGLLPLGLNSDQASIEQSAATNIATEIAADLRQAPTSVEVALASVSGVTLTTFSPKYQIDATSTGKTFYLDEVGMPSSSSSQARYKAVITLIQPSAESPSLARAATCGSIVITWPATASVPLGTVATYLALDRN